MADLTSTLGTNYLKHTIATSDAGRTLIVKVYDSNSALTNATLSSVIGYLTTSHGSDGAGDSAFTVAGLGTATGAAFESGTTDTVFLKLQGTGDVTVATANMGISGVAVSVEAVFQAAL